MRPFTTCIALAGLVAAGCVSDTHYHQSPTPTAAYTPPPAAAPYTPAPAPGPAPVDPGPGAWPAEPVRPGDAYPNPPAIDPRGGSVPGWASQVAQATGVGAPTPNMPPAQARLNAGRAARLDAMRKLAEQIHGLQLSSRTSVRDFVTENDEVRTQLEVYMKGVRETAVRYLPDGTAEVDLEIPLQGVYDIVRPHLQQ